MNLETAIMVAIGIAIGYYAGKHWMQHGTVV